ncbi:MAG: OsmC family protein [Colwellia sp.]|jgi:putative redox protein|uniref:OsmC family protein n=1 Tax=Colwellia sp. Bg11-12 TaxID=2759817 RepID=UPI0015F430A1|nr:OsmC family protein [Colwellia sp. Bg11-12]MBA6265750.1 OsmC family protein [Colwellia sp. Bg11-12]
MRIEVNMLEGQELKAIFGEHEIISDQSITAGGQANHPEPLDYFLASMPLCAAFYIRKFCQQRDISTDGIKVFQDDTPIGENKYQKKFSIRVQLPDNFPEKYKKALMASANTCTVKKVIQAMPEFNISIVP